MTSIEAKELLPAERIRRAVVAGDVTQLHRGDKHASEGDRFEIDDVVFEVTLVREERLGDLTDEDAQAEGSPDLESYKKRIDPRRDVGRRRYCRPPPIRESRSRRVSWVIRRPKGSVPALAAQSALLRR